MKINISFDDREVLKKRNTCRINFGVSGESDRFCMGSHGIALNYTSRGHHRISEEDAFGTSKKEHKISHSNRVIHLVHKLQGVS